MAMAMIWANYDREHFEQNTDCKTALEEVDENIKDEGKNQDEERHQHDEESLRTRVRLA